MTPLERRALLTTLANPAPAGDYVVTLEGAAGDGRRVVLAYVPDRLVVERPAFAAYLAAVARLDWPSLEGLGTSLLDDINDVLVPRWLRVTLRQEAGGVAHGLRLEDRQPRWANDRLLAGV